MPLTIASSVLFAACIPEFFACLVSARGYLRHHYRHFVLMFVTWLSLGAGNLLIALAYLTIDLKIFRAGILVSSPLLYAISFMLDSISRDGVEPVKLAASTSISSLLFAFAFQPGSVDLNVSALGETGPAMFGPFSAAGSAAFAMAGLAWFFYMAKLNANATSQLKGAARLNLLGAGLAGPGSVLAFASGVVWVVPGLDFLLIGLGALACAYSFGRQPKLAYVLPFRVHRLMVVDRGSGLPLYSHTWDEEGLGDPTLFSGAFHGVCAVLDETLGRGLVQEIKFETGLLLLEVPRGGGGGTRVAFVLVTSSSLPILKHAVKNFSRAFVGRFSEQLNSGLTHEVGQFRTADELVREAFPFVVTRR
ncbi:MAG: hypothetical protein Kow0069_30420 [Promethearchaeota archaeon]